MANNVQRLEVVVKRDKLNTYSKYASKETEKELTALLTKLQENGAIDQAAYEGYL